MRAQHWANLGESTFVGGIWFLYGVYRLFGRVPFLLLMYPVVFYYWLLRPVARRASMEYLTRLQRSHAVFDAAPGVGHSLRHFGLFAQTLLDKLLAIGGRYDRGRLQFHGHQALLAAQAAGQGSLIMTAHMGCLELLQTAAGWREGLRLTILVHTGHAERFNRILQRINPEVQVRLLQVESFDAATAMLLANRVAAGEHVAIAGDRVPLRSGRTVSARFLGEMAEFPAGPYLIAAVLRCPVFMLACVHHGTGYSVHIEQLAERVQLPRADRIGAMGDYAARYAAWLEGCVQRSPYDWFNFFPFWDQGRHASSAE